MINLNDFTANKRIRQSGYLGYKFPENAPQKTAISDVAIGIMTACTIIVLLTIFEGFQ
jgi:hypothetical protein